MDTVVLIKQVPDTAGERALDVTTGWIHRDPSEATLDEISARAVEKALQLRAALGGTVNVLAMGPEKAADALKHALAMGADSGVRITDDALAGADAVQTAQVLATALKRMQFDLILAGNSSTDGRGGIVPAMLAEILRLPQATSLRSFDIEEDLLTGHRVLEESTMEIRTRLPAVVSVTEHIADPRHPGFKGIMAARKKETTTLNVADLAPESLSQARTIIHQVQENTGRQAGTKFADDGAAGKRIAEYLLEKGLL